MGKKSPQQDVAFEQLRVSAPSNGPAGYKSASQSNSRPSTVLLRTVNTTGNCTLAQRRDQFNCHLAALTTPQCRTARTLFVKRQVESGAKVYGTAKDSQPYAGDNDFAGSTGLERPGSLGTLSPAGYSKLSISLGPHHSGWGPSSVKMTRERNHFDYTCLPAPLGDPCLGMLSTRCCRWTCSLLQKLSEAFGTQAAYWYLQFSVDKVRKGLGSRMHVYTVALACWYMLIVLSVFWLGRRVVITHPF